MLNVWKKLDNLTEKAVASIVAATVIIATLAGGLLGIRAEQSESARWAEVEAVVSDAHVASKGRRGNQVLADLVVGETTVNAVVGAQTQDGDVVVAHRNRETGDLYRPMPAGDTPTTGITGGHLLVGLLAGIMLAVAFLWVVLHAERCARRLRVISSRRHTAA